MSEREPRRILVVDDDVVSRELLRMLLTRGGYRVEVAESGEAALEMLRRSGTTLPDAVLTDLQMPGVRGESLAGALRSMCSDRVRIVAISGSDVATEMLESFDGFLRKPFSVDGLKHILSGKQSRTSTERPSAVKVLNEDVYKQLSGCMSEEKLMEFYSVCLADTRRRIEVIREAIDSRDDATCRQQAHAIKGSCSMVGALELQYFATLIEGDGITADSVASLHELLLACDRLEGILIETKMRTGPTTEMKKREAAHEGSREKDRR